MPEISVSLALLMILSAAVISTAFYAVTSGNLIRAACALIASLAGLGGIYLLLGNDFLAAVQILLYTGAVAVLILFVVMLTRKSSDSMDGSAGAPRDFLRGGALAVGLLVILLGGILSDQSLAVGKSPIVPQSAALLEVFGLAFTREYFLPVQITGVLLTAAFVGAALIVRRSRSPREKQPADGGTPS
ncbi:NADH-quinone oxidoreductase subunit J [Oscillatoria laete-virens NRMC-F 0139]|nr:NADH-quinone oxidoreductase subunit J [Oscillatoria laete-virens]MDL5054721.1 NADH-quinone oxidoreductase subunit J [Oscillatoria laete-virens NRMC-F 0139]